MTSYAADGFYGSITSTRQGRNALHAAGDGKTAKNVDSVNVVDGEQIISLTSPTTLSFTEISWEFRLSTVFADRALLDYALDQLQYDSDITGFIGAYQPGTRWFEREEGIDEGLEVHGGVDGAWWQLICTGLGRALFTNGTSSVEVDLVAGDMYIVSMSLNSETGFAAVTLWSRHGETLATLSRSGLSIPLSQSCLGVAGTEFNYAGDTQDASGPDGDQFEIFYSSTSAWDGHHQYGQRFYHPGGSTEGFVEGNWDIWPPTGPLGTCSAQAYHSWVFRPYWASCPGKLDNTFVTHITTESWWKLLCKSIPAGYEEGYLEWRPYFAPQQLQYEPPGTSWSGKLLTGWGSPTWPGSWQWGSASGGHVWTQLGWQYIGPFLTPVAGNLEVGRLFYLGVQIDEGSWAEKPPAYTCGFTWPWQNGDLGSWKNYISDPDSWQWRWVLEPEYADPLKVEINQIWFGTPTFVEEDGEIILEENEVSEGWNEEMVRVIDGIATIRATPVQGTVNIYSYSGDVEEQGELLDYYDEWREADDLGLDYRIFTDDTIVSVVYFVSRPVFTNKPILSRPTGIEQEQNRQRGTLAHGT